jgi:pimeloyl-ACP methyl ester carboxylesterase
MARLRAAIDATDAPPLLVGSSMGAFVSGLVSLDVQVAGLILLATPSAVPGYASAFDLRPGVPTMLVHGWNDDVCPLAGVQSFAAQRKLPLLILDDDHRLLASMDAIAAQFRLVLDRWMTIA